MKEANMTAKLKNRIKKMNFQKQINRRVVNEKREDTKYYEEIYRKRTMELLGIHNENIYGTARGGL
jgi:hypothetical protein|tara:strand:+ start:233 stop:430 length:198 start_codon:yes stop_codon:yes gene_type:complete